MEWQEGHENCPIKLRWICMQQNFIEQTKEVSAALKYKKLVQLIYYLVAE